MAILAGGMMNRRRSIIGMITHGRGSPTDGLTTVRDRASRPQDCKYSCVHGREDKA